MNEPVDRKANLKKHLPEALVDELPDDALLLDPEGLDVAVVSITDGRAVYDYGKLIQAFMDVFRGDSLETLSEDELWEHAVEWVHYNTIRALPYMPMSVRPIITGMGDDDEEEDDGED